MKKRTQSLRFSQDTKQRIIERDNYRCLFCTKEEYKHIGDLARDTPDIMHFINKSQGGLGIEENGVLGCRYHHHLLDNGSKGLRAQMLEQMEKRLKQVYLDWDKENLYYRK